MYECHSSLKKLQINYNLQVFNTMIRRVFKKNGFKSAVKAKKPLLLDRHKKARYKFAKNHKHWNYDDWCKVIWSDESKFNLFSSDSKEYC